MEKTQLDFNAPLLSVRRFPSIRAFSKGDNEKLTEKLLPSKSHSLRCDEPFEQVTDPVAVPFLWEQIPGKAKESHKDSKEFNPKIEANMGKCMTSKVGVAHDCDYDGLKNGNHDNGNDDDNDNDACSDGLDSPPQIESFLRCSVSEFSGWDGEDEEPSGTFSRDQETRDFMMSRFIPAAKAMVIDTPPQYVTKKQIVENEDPIEVKTVFNHYRSIQDYDDYKGEKNEEEVDEYNDSSKYSAKGCGLFPRFCAKDSLCLLNPGLCVKVKSHISMGSYCDDARLINTCVSSRRRLDIKNASDYKQILKWSSELHINHDKETSESKPFINSIDSKTTHKSSTTRHLAGGRVSPYKNESSHSPFHEGMHFLGVPKSINDSKENNPPTEKKLFIDSIHSVPIKNSNSSFSNTQSTGLELVCSKVASNGNPDMNYDKIEENENQIILRSPLCPPLPKSPAQSWLWRSSPSISSQNPFLQANFGTRFSSKKASQAPSTNTKWETIVKTSRLHNDHGRYSEELMTHVSQLSQT